MSYTNRSTPNLAHNALQVDKHITAYVLLAGVAGGLVLAVFVMVCCKVCLRKKKPPTRESKDFDAEEGTDSGVPSSWPPQALPESISDSLCTEIELKELPKRKTDLKDPKDKNPDEDLSQDSSPERSIELE